MRVRRAAIVLGVTVVLACSLALPGLAAARSPTLYTATDERFAVRPQFVIFFVTGHEALGRLTDTRGEMKWRSWTDSRARGVGTLWINDGMPSYGQGTFHGHRARVQAWRVRGGHFTRLSVRFRGGTIPWKDGKVLYAWRYELWPMGSGYVWSR